MSNVASGVSGATPIWNKIMKYVTKNKKEEWKIPEGIHKLNVCGKEDYYIDGTNLEITCQPTKTKDQIKETVAQ
jgi:membrane carboxypeptidase/penicillin-binding protein PbpC